MKTPQIAVIASTYFPYSHADVIVSRWLEAWPEDARAGWVLETRIAAMWLDQIPPRDWGDIPLDERKHSYQGDVDLARFMSQKHNVPIYHTIREALCLGGETLAVDGVLLICEHGEYPLNEQGQKLYPRFEFFQQIVEVFREAGRVVPIFHDKALSWNAESALSMAHTVEAMQIPFLGGSSLPHSGFTSDAIGEEPPLGAAIEEMVLCFSVGPEAYGFHSIDWSHAILEGRSVGPLRSLCIYEGDDVWKALESGAWSSELFEAMLARCTIAPNPGGEIKADCLQATLNRGSWPARSEFVVSPVAFSLHYENGPLVTHCLLRGHTDDFALALRWRDSGGQSHLFAARSQICDTEDVLLGHFARLNTNIQQMVMTGESVVPVQRTLDSSLAMSAVMDTLYRQIAPGETVKVSPPVLLPVRVV